jgi:ankyrin repeat protein
MAQQQENSSKNIPLRSKPSLDKHKPASDGLITQKQLDLDLFNYSLYGWTKEARMMLDQGANPNAIQSELGATALMKASVQGHFAICKLLIEKGADVNAKSEKGDPKGVTALMCAASSGCPDICRLLIEHGAEIDAKDGYRRTALYYAGMRGRTDICKFLVDKGADALAKADLNRTASMIALENKFYSTSSFLERMERIQQLVGRDYLNEFVSNFYECISGGK